jgi:hypothetical protein
MENQTEVVWPFYSNRFILIADSVLSCLKKRKYPKNSEMKLLVSIICIFFAYNRNIKDGAIGAQEYDWVWTW